MLTEQHIEAVKVLRECGCDEYEIVDNFDSEGIAIFLWEVRLILAEKPNETRNQN